MKKTIYVSGPITPSPKYPNRKKNLKRFVDKALELMNEYAVMMPSENNEKIGKRGKLIWGDFMDQDLPFVIACHAIYMLKGWETSDGAVVEHSYAKKYKKKIIYEK